MYVCVCVSECEGVFVCSFRCCFVVHLFVTFLSKLVELRGTKLTSLDVPLF